MWLSISPGMTVRPLRSIRLVSGPASLAISCARADRHDAIAADGDRLRDREAIVDGDDLAVREHQVRGRAGRRALRLSGRAQDLKCAGGRTQRNRNRTGRSPSCHKPRS